MENKYYRWKEVKWNGMVERNCNLDGETIF